MIWRYWAAGDGRAAVLAGRVIHTKHVIEKHGAGKQVQTSCPMRMLFHGGAPCALPALCQK
jgi:hypothetical protein